MLAGDVSPSLFDIPAAAIDFWPGGRPEDYVWRRVANIVLKAFDEYFAPVILDRAIRVGQLG